MAGEENERGKNIRIHVMPTHIPLARNSPKLIAREAGNMRRAWSTWWKPTVSNSPIIHPLLKGWGYRRWDYTPAKPETKWMLKSFLKSSASPIPGVSSLLLEPICYPLLLSILLSFPVKFNGCSPFTPRGTCFAFPKKGGTDGLSHLPQSRLGTKALPCPPFLVCREKAFHLLDLPWVPKGRFQQLLIRGVRGKMWQGERVAWTYIHYEM